MGLIKNWTTNGGEHFKYQQYYNGIKVEGAQFILHQNQNNTITGNGKLANNLNLIVLPILFKDSCIAIAKYHFLNEILNTPSTLINNLKEKALLIINFSVGNSLDYKINFYSDNFDYTYYVNTGNGEIKYFHDNHLHSLESKMTNYNGIQNVELSIPITNQLIDTIYSPGSFEIDLITPPGFYLNDTTRGEGINVDWYNYVQTNSNASFTQFGKSTTHSNENQEYFIKGAIQSLWGSQVFYDFINEKFNLNSIDDNGIKLNINVNRNNTQNSAHAFFHHQLKEDSNGLEIPGTDSVLIHLSNYSTSLNVVGHEWGHGLVKFGPNLLISGEAFILNEGFGDIFGNLLEIYANKKFNLNIDNPDWIGNSEEPLNFYFNRSMKNPNKYLNPNSVNKRYPSFYQGNFWQPLGDFDFQHHDATVLSHWFYVLSIGGLYINEVGDKYYIQGIGIEEASQLIIQVLREGLLTEDASFHDVRDASFQTSLAQQDSCLRFSIQQAWDYVGVYDSTNILSVIDTSIFLANDTIFNNTDISTAKKIAGIIRVQSALTLNTSDFHILPHSSIIVENGGSLTINHANLYFDENTGIIVESGGSLIINFSLLTYGIDTTACVMDSAEYELWNGIVFNGNGILNIDSSIISYTDSGLVVNASVFTLKNSSYLNNITPVTINNQVSSTNSILIRNNLFKSDNDFYDKYPKRAYLELNGTAKLEVFGNKFQMDNYSPYPLGNSYGIKLENDLTNSSLGSILAIDNEFINCNKGIYVPTGTFKYVIKSNKFRNSTSDKDGAGISLYNSNYTNNDSIHDNKFFNLYEAIYIENIPNLNISENIIDSCATGIKANFNSNLNVVGNIITGSTAEDKGIYIINCNTLTKIDTNTIKDVGQAIEVKGSNDIELKANVLQNISYSYTKPIGYGIFMQACENFEIKDNLISGVGIQDNVTIANAGIRGIVIENATTGNNKVFRNDIRLVKIGIQTQLNNNSLRTKCNTTKAKSLGLLIFDNLEMQGRGCVLDPVTNKQILPGNDWENNCYSQGNLFNDITLDASALNHSFAYFAHINGAAGERTAPDCNNINTGTGSYTVCNGVGFPQQIMATDFCSDANLYTGWRMQEENEDILIANIPQEIINLLAEKLNIANQMIAVEALITDSKTQKDLVNKLNYLQAEVSNINRIIVGLYEQTGNRPAAQLLLEQEESIDAKLLLAQQYIENDEPVNAQRIINEILLMNTPDEAFFNEKVRTDYELNKDYIAEILEIENSARTSNRTIAELTEVEKINLRWIRDKNLPISTKAECILALNGDDLLVHPIKVMSQEYINQLQTDLVFNYQLSINPNPTSADVTIHYDLPIDLANYKLEIIDNYQNIGNIKKTQNISNTSSITLNVNSYNSGVYTVVIYRNDISVATAQLVVLH